MIQVTTIIKRFRVGLVRVHVGAQVLGFPQLTLGGDIVGAGSVGFYSLHRGQVFRYVGRKATVCTGNLRKQWIFGPSRSRNTIWAKSRKYNMGQKQKIHAEAHAENISGPHDVGRPSAARHHVVIHHVVP